MLWAGQTVSLTGSAVTAVALPLAAISLLRVSAFDVGLLTAASYGAFLLVALPAGAVMDRLSKRTIMIWCDGLLATLGSLGGIAGGLLVSSLTRRIGSARIMWSSLLVLGAPSLVLPLAQPGWRVSLFVLGNAVSAFACAVFSASQSAYRQSVCPAELRGRMNAASRWLIWGTLPFGGILAGSLGSVIGIRPSIWIAYAGSWAAGFLVLFSPLRNARDV